MYAEAVQDGGNASNISLLPSSYGKGSVDEVIRIKANSLRNLATHSLHIEVNNFLSILRAVWNYGKSVIINLKHYVPQTLQLRRSTLETLESEIVC